MRGTPPDPGTGRPPPSRRTGTAAGTERGTPPQSGKGQLRRRRPHRFESGRRIGRRSVPRPGRLPMRTEERHRSQEPAAAEGHGRIVREPSTDRSPIRCRRPAPRPMWGGARLGAQDAATWLSSENGNESRHFLILPCSGVGIFSGDHFTPVRTKKELAWENKPCTYHPHRGRVKPRLRIGRCP
jgi:hypothetical protein